MPSLKEIKSRIASVNSTRKITSAMKMVASSKLHHAQTAIENMLPYENMLEHILKTFLVSAPDVAVRSGASCEEGCADRFLFQLVALWRIQCQYHQDDAPCYRRIS